MSNRARRRFLQQSAALVTGMAATQCSTGPVEPLTEVSSAMLDRSTLDAVARVALPQETLGDAGVSVVVDEFVAWLEAFEPVAELDHPYLWTDEIAYGASDPAPRWGSQLEALELEAQKRHEARYVELEHAQQLAILKRQLPVELGSELPYAGDAAHVAIGLIAYFYRTSQANDIGYGAAIEKQTCRGLDTGPDEPGRLSKLA